MHHYLRYSKALKQRNSLLKKVNLKILKPFEQILVKSGSYLIKARDDFLNCLQEPMKKELKEIFNIEIDCSLKYISSISINQDIENSFSKTLDKNRKKDLDFKTTLLGPHRDDFLIYLDKKSAKTFASEGQKKLILYSLLFAEWHSLYKKTNPKPLLLKIHPNNPN